MIKKLLKPIENIEEAMLNPGNEELDTHLENEDKVIHSIDEVVYEEHVNSVQEKLLKLLRDYYNSVDDVISLEEFYYDITEEELIIYDRFGIYLLSDNIINYFMNEIDWIFENLPIFNNGMNNIDTSNTHIEFHSFRKDGWMVFRRSGSYNQLIGWIRKNLHQVSNNPWYFDDRDDYCIVTDAERRQINDFIGNYDEVINVSRIIVSPTNIRMKIGSTQEISVLVYPFNATDRSYTIEYDKSLLKLENNIITALNEGLTTISISSNQNPSIVSEINVEVYEYDKLVNEIYNIVRKDTDEFDKYKDHNIYEYIIGMKEHLRVSDFLNSFSNNRINIEILDKNGNWVEDNQELATGMVVKLKTNGKYTDELHIVIKGDVNGDGLISWEDPYIIRQFVNGDVDLKNEYFIAGDVNETGSTNLLDVDQIEEFLRNERTEFEKYVDPDLNRYEGPFTYSGFLTGTTSPNNPDYRGRISGMSLLYFKDNKTGLTVSRQFLGLCTRNVYIAVTPDYPALPLIESSSSPVSITPCTDSDREHIFKEFTTNISNLTDLAYLGIANDTTIRACPRCGFVDKIYSPSTKEVYWSDDMRIKTPEDCILPGTYTILSSHSWDWDDHIFRRIEMTPKIAPKYPSGISLPITASHRAWSSLRYNWDYMKNVEYYPYFPSAENKVLLTQSGYDIEQVNPTESGRVYYNKSICNGNHSYTPLYPETSYKTNNTIKTIFGSDKVVIDYCWKCGHIGRMRDLEINYNYWESNGDDEWFSATVTSMLDNYSSTVFNGSSSSSGEYCASTRTGLKVGYQSKASTISTSKAGCIGLGLQTDNISSGLYSSNSNKLSSAIPSTWRLVQMLHNIDINPFKRSCTKHAHMIVKTNNTMMTFPSMSSEKYAIDFCPYCNYIHKIFSQESDYIYWDSTNPCIIKGDINEDGRVDITDATIINNVLQDKVSLDTQLQNINADVDNDGSISKFDMFLIEMYILYKIDDFSQESIKELLHLTLNPRVKGFDLTETELIVKQPYNIPALFSGVFKTDPSIIAIYDQNNILLCNQDIIDKKEAEIEQKADEADPNWGDLWDETYNSLYDAWIDSLPVKNDYIIKTTSGNKVFEEYIIRLDY